MENFVITIGRYCGSGGSVVANMLAEKLGIEVYDRKILSLASNDSGINEETFEQADEDLRRSLLYKVSRSAYDGEPIITADARDNVSDTANRNLYNYQERVIKGLADSSSCVIIGRCADYMLRDRYNVLRVFISSTRESRAERESKRSRITLSEAFQKVDKIDRKRSDYYRFYTGQTWADPAQYDLCLNTDVYTFEQCVDMIIAALKVKLGE
ncbi:MAG: cytidylate kinase-like family protein [Clostridia bacterium]|nr:cytidylate kinase-like family protein [Clostridia bacterium]